MKEKLLIFAALIGVIIIMILLNAATYVQKAKEPDKEFTPNRSTFNPGSTGTMAFFTLLAESGRKVSRWQLPADALTAASSESPSTFVIVGPQRREYTDDEKTALLSWVSGGGRLVIIDRTPEPSLVATTAEWEVSVPPHVELDLMSVDPANQSQMTQKTDAVKPAIPTVYTAGVNAVQPSRFASSVRISRCADVDLEMYYPPAEVSESPPPPAVETDYEQESAPSPTPHDFYQAADPDRTNESNRAVIEEETVVPPPAKVEPETAWFKAPVAHLTAGDRNLLVDMPYGEGRIVILADPFIVANGGIRMADNAQLAVNLVSAGGGLVAFDEYHHGYGSGNNRVIEYFDGTPVAAIFLQLIAIVGFVLISRSRRFARPVPEPEPDRLSKLEYVAAMAELQMRTGAYDLAMENIYSDFRRRASRLVGVDNSTTPRRELASRIAERMNADPSEVEDLMFKCEDIVHGEPTNKREMKRLVEQIREIEGLIGLSRRGRTGI